MSGPVTPILILTGVSFANNWYNTKSADLKIPLAGAVAAALASFAANIPDFEPVVTGIAWVALVGYLIAEGAGASSPVSNLSKIAGGK